MEPKHTSPRGIAFIMLQEGFRDEVYQDSAGHNTIGFGHKLRAGEKFAAPLTRQQAEALLQRDIAGAEHSVNAHVQVPIAQQQYDALVSLVFNIGGKAFFTSTLLRVLNLGQYAAAAREFSRWNKTRIAGKLSLSAGLAARRAAECALFTEGTTSFV